VAASAAAVGPGPGGRRRDSRHPLRQITGRGGRLNRFWPLVTRPVLELVQAEAVVEIGAATGAHTRLLKPWCVEHGASLHVIDPLPEFEVAKIEDAEAGIRVDQRLSVDALAGAEPVDVALVDGDHNYYTVRRELEILLANSREAGRAEPVFLCHDVCWPYGRRDLYYDPANIPDEHRHPCRTEGIVPGQSELAGDKGLNARLHNAEHEGGPRNGVLTAIEDVVAESDGSLQLTVLPVIYGLGIVVPASRVERHPGLRPWLERWGTVEGWADLAALAEAERRLGDQRLQRRATAGTGQRRKAERPRDDTRVEEVHGRSFRTALPARILSAVQRGTLNTHYRGMRFYKNPFDLVLYMMLLDRLLPATVLEVGTKEGGSALWFADQQAVRGIEPRVVTVDIEKPPELDDPRVTSLRGDALALGEVLPDDLLATLPRPWLVVEDSAHLFETSLAVLEFFHAHLRRGEYIVVEDGNLADFVEPRYAQFEDGPNRAVKHFLEARGDDYAIDTKLCDHYGHNVTWSPNGWLRRS
jgi:cephalosporin hydroxylase